MTLNFTTEASEPYEVACARCGKVGMCDEFAIEEGDEWECIPCWDRCNAKEREDAERRRNEYI